MAGDESLSSLGFLVVGAIFVNAMQSSMAKHGQI
jgi:hypothetical protein